jgi:acetyl-CoA carboxylase beta subunit
MADLLKLKALNNKEINKKITLCLQYAHNKHCELITVAYEGGVRIYDYAEMLLMDIAIA